VNGTANFLFASLLALLTVYTKHVLKAVRSDVCAAHKAEVNPPPGSKDVPVFLARWQVSC
jgi:hypothetical protein